MIITRLIFTSGSHAEHASQAVAGLVQDALRDAKGVYLP